MGSAASRVAPEKHLSSPSIDGNKKLSFRACQEPSGLREVVGLEEGSNPPLNLESTSEPLCPTSGEPYLVYGLATEGGVPHSQDFCSPVTFPLGMNFFTLTFSPGLLGHFDLQTTRRAREEVKSHVGVRVLVGRRWLYRPQLGHIVDCPNTGGPS